MSRNYDNWERLVRVVLRREHDRQLALSHSRDSSTISSVSSSFCDTSQFDFHEFVEFIVPMNYSDLRLDHNAWRSMLSPDDCSLVYRSAAMSFFLDSWTGKNCFLFGAAKLEFHGTLVTMETRPNSRFEEVGMVSLHNLDIRGKISSQILSPWTLYAVYLVFDIADENANAVIPASSGIRTVHHYQGSDYESNEDDVYDGYSRWQRHIVLFQLGEDRADGWREIQLGDFYVNDGDELELEARILNVNGGGWGNCHLVVEGIEFRPSETHQYFEIGR